jgi:hypothetical protein
VRGSTKSGFLLGLFLHLLGGLETKRNASKRRVKQTQTQAKAKRNDSEPEAKRIQTQTKAKRKRNESETKAQRKRNETKAKRRKNRKFAKDLGSIHPTESGILLGLLLHILGLFWRRTNHRSCARINKEHHPT